MKERIIWVGYVLNVEFWCIPYFRMCWWRDVLHFSEDVQQFEKSVLGRSSRGRSEKTTKVAEDDSENDKGTDSEGDKDDEDDNEAPKKRPVSPYVLIHRVASIMIYETRSDQRKEKYYGFFTRSIWRRMIHVISYNIC